MKTLNPIREKIAVYSSPDNGVSFQVFIGLNSQTVRKTFNDAKSAMNFVSEYNSWLSAQGTPDSIYAVNPFDTCAI